MSKASNSMDVRADWHFRGLVHQSTNQDIFNKLNSGSVSAYAGFDPSAPSLHLGHLIPLCTLRRLQLSGNAPVVLMGGGTGLIGDPSFKDAERPLLSREVLEENIGSLTAQVERFLDFSPSSKKSKATIVNNADWLTNMSLTTFLRTVGKHFTINQMVAKESVKSRLNSENQGLSFTEFSYMLLQAYDFLRLNVDHGVSLQLGGSEQWGNIVMGVELVRKETGSLVSGITTPLLLRADGKKFGKSEVGNESVWLDANLTSPFALHQFLLNSDDQVTPELLKYLTFLSHERINELHLATFEHPKEHQAQRVLANEVVSLVHGEETAKKAEASGKALASGSLNGLSDEALQEIVKSSPSTNWSREALLQGVDVVDILTTTRLVKTRSEATRILSQGGVYVNNVRVASGAKVDLSSATAGKYLVLRRGPQQMHILVAS